MTKEEIIGGLQFTVDMFLLDPNTGETYTEPRNDMDKTTIDACKGAIELLEQTRWIPLSERLPKKGEQVLCCNNKSSVFTSAVTYVSDDGYAYFGQHFDVIAWMPLPEPYKGKKRERGMQGLPLQ